VAVHRTNVGALPSRPAAFARWACSTDFSVKVTHHFDPRCVAIPREPRAAIGRRAHMARERLRRRFLRVDLVRRTPSDQGGCAYGSGLEHRTTKHLQEPTSNGVTLDNAIGEPRGPTCLRPIAQQKKPEHR